MSVADQCTRCMLACREAHSLHYYNESLTNTGAKLPELKVTVMPDHRPPPQLQCALRGFRFTRNKSQMTGSLKQCTPYCSTHKMPATPRRQAQTDQTQTAAQSLVGQSVAIPADIFKESESQYTGKVTGTPKRKKNAVYVKVDQDNSEYWFPADEVAKWVIKESKAAATLSTPKTPKSRPAALQKSSPKRTSAAASNQPAPRGTRSQQPAAPDSSQHQEFTLPNSQVQQVHDASSCHPERPEDLAETIEGLVSRYHVHLQHCRICMVR